MVDLGHRGSLIAAAALLASCGADFAGDDDGTTPDAGIPGCEVFADFDPALPVAPATVIGEATITTSGDLFGTREITWVVEPPAGPSFEPEPLDAGNTRVSFAAAAPGIYEVHVFASIGGVDCDDYEWGLNVSDGTETAFVLHALPSPEHAAPPQQLDLRVTGPEFSLDLALSAGVAVTANAGAPAYLRATDRAAAGLAVEGFADAAGDFALRLRPTATYDLLIVPEGNAIAPALLTELSTGQITGTLDLATADTVTGVVLDAAGDPVAGARVALSVGGVPSTVATTDAAGAFALQARLDGALLGGVAVTVAPAGGALPTLELPASAGLTLAPGEPLTIRYAPGTAARTESFTVVTSTAAAAPGARVHFAARSIAAAGTVAAGATAPLDAPGTARVDAVADGAGALPALALPPAVYDVAVIPADAATAAEPGAVAVLDLTAGAPAPAALALAAPAPITGTLSPSLSNMRVVAVPRGAAARAGAATLQTTATGGVFTLPAVAGADYDLVIDPPLGSSRARARATATAPATLTDIAIPEGLELSGTVTVGGAPAPGVYLMFLCAACTGPDAALPVAEALSGAGGSYRVRLPRGN